jgi:DNA polymerase family B, exonuclease domain
MTRRQVVYGLDIETDTSDDGLDPRVARVVTVALSFPGHDEIFSGRESTLLYDLDTRLRELPAGVLTTWNGAAFDLPFLAHRAALHELDLGLRLALDPSLAVHAPLPGHRGAYRGAWHQHSHLDAYRLYKGDVGPMLRVSCSLKSIARLVGLLPIEVDRTRIHDLSREALHAYASSDARLARVLTERRMPGAARFIDRLVEPGAAQGQPGTAAIA